MIEVLFFARLAELTGVRQTSWPLAQARPASQVVDALKQRYPALAEVKNLRLAINQTHAPLTSSVAPGDELALFEPVTGG